MTEEGKDPYSFQHICALPDTQPHLALRNIPDSSESLVVWPPTRLSAGAIWTDFARNQERSHFDQYSSGWEPWSDEVADGMGD